MLVFIWLLTITFYMVYFTTRRTVGLGQRIRRVTISLRAIALSLSLICLYPNYVYSSKSGRRDYFCYIKGPFPLRAWKKAFFVCFIDFFCARFNRRSIKEHSLFVLLIIFCARFNGRLIKETKMVFSTLVVETGLYNLLSIIKFDVLFKHLKKILFKKIRKFYGYYIKNSFNLAFCLYCIINFVCNLCSDKLIKKQKLQEINKNQKLVVKARAKKNHLILNVRIYSHFFVCMIVVEKLFSTLKARFHYERGKKHSLFVLLLFFCARFNFNRSLQSKINKRDKECSFPRS